MVSCKKIYRIKMDKCYCKSGLDFSVCCEPILRVDKVANTALELMRSRTLPTV